MNLNALKPETFSTDKLDYFFKPDEVEEGDLFRELQQEYTDMRRVDYCVDEECKLPLSFTKIKNVEQGIEWYKLYHPELCDDIIEMISKYQFGNLPVKHTRHTYNKKKKKQEGITITNKLTTLNFDD